MTPSLVQFFTSGSKDSNIEQMDEVKFRWLHKIPPHFWLDMPWWKLSSHNRLGMDTVTVSLHTKPTTTTHIECKTPPTVYQSNLSVVYLLELFLKYCRLTIYGIYSDSRPSEGPTPAGGTKVSPANLDAWISSLV